MFDYLIRKSEKLTRSNMDYVRKLRRLSLSALLKFFLVPLASTSNSRNADARAVARLVSTLFDDCGECLKICVFRSQQEGVSRALIEAVVERRPEALSPDLRLVYALCFAALEARPESVELSRQVEERLGGKVLADVSMQLALARFYPTFKRAMGVATTECLMPSALFAS